MFYGVRLLASRPTLFSHPSLGQAMAELKMSLPQSINVTEELKLLFAFFKFPMKLRCSLLLLKVFICQQEYGFSASAEN